MQCQSSAAGIVWPLQGPMELLGPDLTGRCGNTQVLDEFNKREVEMIS